MAEKFVIFEDAAKELRMSADGLKKLMDEGKIRHFMDSGKIKFRQKDIDDLKASLGIKDAEDELSLAPPDEMPPIPQPQAETEAVPAPPAYKEDEFSIEPIDDSITPSTAAAVLSTKKSEPRAAAPVAEKKEEEVASLSDFEVDSAEDQGAEISGEEAEILAMQGSLRGKEDGAGAGVGMTVVLVVAVVVIGFGVMVLLSFPMDTNPFVSLTSLFDN